MTSAKMVVTEQYFEYLKRYKWIGSPPDPWLPHFLPPHKTLYCKTCRKWVIPPDSEILWTTNLYHCTRGRYDEELGSPQPEPVTCPTCGTKLELKPEGYFGPLKWMWWKHNLVPINKDLGVTPRFLDMLMEKINAGKSVQITFTGRAGEGKSYVMIALARIINPFMTIDDVIFERENFISAVRYAKPGTVLCVDETSYMAGKRSWQNPDQQQLMLIWESMRFKLLPVFTTILNISLYDKTLREFLIVFQVNMRERGVADSYSLHPHPLMDRVTFHHIQRLYLDMPDWNYCRKKSCLLPRCGHIDICPLLRGQYEKKKGIIQDKRYEKAQEKVEKSKVKSFEEWLRESLAVVDKCYIGKEGEGRWGRRVSVDLLHLHLKCSNTIARKLGQIYNSQPIEEVKKLIDTIK